MNNSPCSFFTTPFFFFCICIYKNASTSHRTQNKNKRLSFFPTFYLILRVVTSHGTRSTVFPSASFLFWCSIFCFVLLFCFIVLVNCFHFHFHFYLVICFLFLLPLCLILYLFCLHAGLVYHTTSQCTYLAI